MAIFGSPGGASSGRRQWALMKIEKSIKLITTVLEIGRLCGQGPATAGPGEDRPVRRPAVGEFRRVLRLADCEVSCSDSTVCDFD